MLDLAYRDPFFGRFSRVRGGLSLPVFPANQFILYAGDMSGTGLTTPAVVTASGGVVSAVAAQGSYGLSFTAQGSGADILAVPGGLQFANGKYLRAVTSKTLKRVQVAIEYTLLSDSAGSAFPVEVARASAPTRARVRLNTGVGAGTLTIVGPADQQVSADLASYYGDRNVMAFEIDLTANTITAVADDNWSKSAAIATPPANIPVTEIRIGSGCNALFHKIAILMEDAA